MIDSRLEELLMDNPVVAAIRNNEELETVIKSNVKVVFVLYGSILNIKEICDSLEKLGKEIFVHIDMIEGLKGDQKSIEFIKKHVNPMGIITTKPTNIKYAKSLGLKTIQRIFVIDSLSLKTGVKNIEAVQPTAVEVMPGVSKKIIKFLKEQVKVPVIAGGLISEKCEVIDSISCGAIAVSTTAENLWSLNE